MSERCRILDVTESRCRRRSLAVYAVRVDPEFKSQASHDQWALVPMCRSHVQSLGYVLPPRRARR